MNRRQKEEWFASLPEETREYINRQKFEAYKRRMLGFSVLVWVLHCFIGAAFIIGWLLQPNDSILRHIGFITYLVVVGAAIANWEYYRDRK